MHQHSSSLAEGNKERRRREKERDLEAGGEKSTKSRVKYWLENCMVIVIATGICYGWKHRGGREDLITGQIVFYCL